MNTANAIRPYTPPEPKNIIIYHDKCADGFGAAFAAWKKFGDNAAYLPFSYGQELTSEDFDLFCGNNIYILDFSFPRETMEHIMDRANDFVWLDHHKTAFEMWTGAYKRGDRYHELMRDTLIILDDKQSGAMLAWKYFVHSENIPPLIRFIDDYDRWVFQYPTTKAFNKALWLQSPFTFKSWDVMVQFSDAVDGMIDIGEALLKAHNNQVRDVIAAGKKQCSIVTGKGVFEFNHIGLTVNAPKHLASDIGHELATECGTYGLVWYMRDTGVINCSLRSNGDYDVSAIAKQFGGGGHKNAAGFECSIQQLYEFLSN